MKRIGKAKGRVVVGATVILVVIGVGILMHVVRSPLPGGPTAGGDDDYTLTTPLPGSSTSVFGDSSGATGSSPGQFPDSQAIFGDEPAQAAPSAQGFDASGLPGHKLVLTVTSPGAIGTVGYLIPTTQERPKAYGVAKNVGKSWSLSTEVYSYGPYADIFLQAGPLGLPITCTITVDGKVTDRKTSTGPYSRMLCMG
ncbi:MAG: hypothetical protein JWR35_1634 [Marmoricola sp.]|nr:hypothetical protein [Marmoricola sp.]